MRGKMTANSRTRLLNRDNTPMRPDQYCDMVCVKLLLMLFNVIFWLSGLAIAWSGIILQTDLQKYLRVSTYYSTWTPHILIIIGVVIAIVATLACSCTIKNRNTYMLNIYGTFLLITLFAIITLVAYIYSYRDQLTLGIDEGLRYDIHNYSRNSHRNHVLSIDVIQEKLKCCGVNNYKDWLMISPKKSIPKSCCQFRNGTCQLSENSTDLYPTGCSIRLKEILNENIALLGSIITGVAFFPLFGAILSCCLANSKRSRYEILI